MHENIAIRIERFIRDECRVAQNDMSFTREAHLFDAGFIDSTHVAELVVFIEATFGIEIPETDLFAEEFTTINGISAIVAKCLDGTQAEHEDSFIAAPDRPNAAAE